MTSRLEAGGWSSGGNGYDAVGGDDAVGGYDVVGGSPDPPTTQVSLTTGTTAGLPNSAGRWGGDRQITVSPRNPQRERRASMG